MLSLKIENIPLKNNFVFKFIKLTKINAIGLSTTNQILVFETEDGNIANIYDFLRIILYFY